MGVIAAAVDIVLLRCLQLGASHWYAALVHEVPIWLSTGHAGSAIGVLCALLGLLWALRAVGVQGTEHYNGALFIVLVGRIPVRYDHRLRVRGLHALLRLWLSLGLELPPQNLKPGPG